MAESSTRELQQDLKNLIRSVGLRAELFASAQEFFRSNRPNVGPAAWWSMCSYRD